MNNIKDNKEYNPADELDENLIEIDNLKIIMKHKE